jgi:hypothetical protein
MERCDNEDPDGRIVSQPGFSDETRFTEVVAGGILCTRILTRIQSASAWK